MQAATQSLTYVPFNGTMIHLQLYTRNTILSSSSQPAQPASSSGHFFSKCSWTSMREAEVIGLLNQDVDGE